MSLRSIPCQVICAAACSSGTVKWRSHPIILWAVGNTRTCNCYSREEQMLWMKRQRKYQSLPSQQNVAAKSYIAEGMEVSIRTIYLALTPIPCWFLRLHPIFLHKDFPTTQVLRDLGSFLLLPLGIISLHFLFSLHLHPSQLGPMMQNQTINRSVFILILWFIYCYQLVTICSTSSEGEGAPLSCTKAGISARPCLF